MLTALVHHVNDGFKLCFIIQQCDFNVCRLNLSTFTDDSKDLGTCSAIVTCSVWTGSMNFPSKIVGEKLSFNIYRRQVQGISLSIWGVVRRELRF